MAFALKPVDHNPFDVPEGAEGGLRLVPVEGDPFAPPKPKQERPGVLSEMGSALVSGAKSGAQGIAVSALGAGAISPETAADIVTSPSLKSDYVRSPETTDFFNDIDAGEYWSAAKRLASSPARIIGPVAAEGMGSSILPIGGAVAGSLAGPVGMAAGVGAGSLVVDAGSTMLEFLRDKGVNLKDRSQVAAAFSNLDLMAEARADGLKHGIPVAAFDAFSAGIAGRLVSGASGVGQTVRRAAGEAGIQAGLGGAGEASGQLVQKGKIDKPSDVVAEIIGEVPGSALEIGRGAALHRKPAEPKPTTEAKTDEPAVPPPPPGSGQTAYATIGGELVEIEILNRGLDTRGNEIVIFRGPDGLVDQRPASELNLRIPEAPKPDSPYGSRTVSPFAAPPEGGIERVTDKPAVPSMEDRLRDAGIRTEMRQPGSEPEFPRPNEPQVEPPPIERALQGAGLRTRSVPAGPEVSEGELAAEQFREGPPALPKPTTIYGPGFSATPRTTAIEQPGPEAESYELAAEREQERVRSAPLALPKPARTYGPGFSFKEPDAYSKARDAIQGVPYGKAVPMAIIQEAVGAKTPREVFPLRDELAKNGLLAKRGVLWVRSQPQSAAVVDVTATPVQPATEQPAAAVSPAAPPAGVAVSRPDPAGGMIEAPTQTETPPAPAPVAEQAAVAPERPAGVEPGTKDAPKPLYVNRPVQNAQEIIDWAKSQGFDSTLTPDDLHVTVAYSREPVDWNAAGPAEVSAEATPKGRAVEKLGDEGAVVLRFDSDQLQGRHQQYRDTGASWDYPGYKPHVTITYKGDSVNLSKVKPYDGPIVLGPERQDTIKENAAEDVREAPTDVAPAASTESGPAKKAAATPKTKPAADKFSLGEPASEPVAGAFDDLRKTLKKLVGDKVDLEKVGRIDTPAGEAKGRYLSDGMRRVIQLATEDASVMRHEVIHALRDMGVIEPKSWAALEKAAPAWRRRFKVDDRYGGLKLSDEQLNEEAIAEAYAAWADGKLNVMGTAAKIFARIKQFIDGLRNWMDGNGWRSAEDVFRAIEGGEYASRDVADMALKNPKDVYALSQASLSNRANTVLDAIKDWRGVLGRLGDPLAKVSQSDLYKEFRYLAQGKIAGWQENAKAANDAFNAADAADQKRVYDYLTTANATTGSIQNAKARDMAEKVKDWIDQLGRELVARDVLRPETYLAYKDSYLPRLYLKFVLDDAKGTGGGGRPSSMGYTKGRKELSEEVRKLVLGEIEDPAFLSAVNLSVKGRDIAILDLLRQVADNPEWVAKGQMVDWRGKRVTPQWLAAEADAVRKQIPSLPESRRAGATAVADEMRRTADTTLEAQGEFPDTYKQVPDTKRYGAMRGLWIDKGIYDDLLTSVGMQNPDPSWAEQWLGVGGYGTKATQLWKLGKVALNPPTQIRNLMSNVVLLNMGGVPLYRIPGALKQAVSEMKNDGPHWKVAKEFGVKGTGFSASELYKIEREFADLDAKSGKPWSKIKRFAQRFVEGAGDLYQASESLFKTAYIIDAMERKGQTKAEAAIGSNKWMFDYSSVPPSVRYLRNSPFGIPFASWMYKSLPRLLEASATRPWVVAGWTYGLSFALGEAFKAANPDLDDDDQKKLMAAYPEWARDKGSVYLFPYKDSAGRWQFFDFSYILPWGQAQEIVNKGLKGDPGELAKAVGLFGAPIASLAAALTTNIDPFTNRPITQKGDPPSQKIEDSLKYLWTMAAPPWATEQGFAQKIIDAANMKPVDKYGNPGATMTQATARVFGINVYGLDPDLSRTKNIQGMKAEVDTIKQRLGQVAKDQRLTPDDRKERVGEIEAYLKSKAAQMQAYADSSQIPDRLKTGRQ